MASSNVWDTSSIQWNYKNVIARIRLVFPEKLPIKVCQHQYLPSYRHSLKCAGSNNDIQCSVFDRNGIQGVRNCEYDANTSSPFPNEKLNCCLGQSAYTCCIRRCGFDNTQCYDDDPDLHNVLFQKMDSEYQRRTASIGGVKSGCYTAMGNIDTDTIFSQFGHARPRCVNGQCRQQCLSQELTCPSKSCSTKQCFMNSTNCSYDGNWTMDVSKDTIDPQQISGSVVCEFFFDFPKSYNLTDSGSLQDWMNDLTVHTVPLFSSPLSVMAVVFHASLIFYNDVYHLSEEYVNQFSSQKFISKGKQTSLDTYKRSLVLPFESTLSKLSMKNDSSSMVSVISQGMTLPYLAGDGTFYLPLSSRQMDNLMVLQNTQKATTQLENMLSQFLQDVSTNISPSSLYSVKKSKIVWRETNISNMFVNVMEQQVTANGKINLTTKKMTYENFMTNTKDRFLFSYEIPLEIVSFSPMLVAYLESRDMLKGVVPLDKIQQDTSLLPLSFLQLSPATEYEAMTSGNCFKEISNGHVMVSPQELFVCKGSSACRCLQSMLVPTAASFEKGYDNKTSMCFQKDCQDALSKEAYGLDDAFCRSECSAMKSWLPVLPNQKDFDEARYKQLCMVTPPTPPPGPPPTPLPSDGDMSRKVVLFTVAIVLILFVVFLIFYFGVNKLFG